MNARGVSMNVRECLIVVDHDETTKLSSYENHGYFPVEVSSDQYKEFKLTIPPRTKVSMRAIESLD
jgi:hypothetical protein